MTVKTSGVQGLVGLSQLATWSIAHFESLRTLAATEHHTEPQITRIMGVRPLFPVHPILVVQGHRWILYWASLFANPDGDGPGHRLDLYESDSEMGNTSSVLGVYKLLQSLRELGGWTLGWSRNPYEISGGEMKHRYLPWWRREILKLDNRTENTATFIHS